MNRHLSLLFIIGILSVSPLSAEEPETRFLNPGELIFSNDFDTPSTLEKPVWYLRKSDWIVETGALRGTNRDGNGPFIRLQSKENGGPLPEDYIMTFSFKVEENPDEEKSNKHHDTLSSGHRFSFGHYAAKFQWRADCGMDLNIGHGDVLEDSCFHIEKGQWYHVTAEIRGDEVLVWFKDGPAYYLQHDFFRSKPSGWEFFTHISEIGYLDNLKVWSLAEGELPGWHQTRFSILSLPNQSFLSADHPEFQITKQDK
tara:strand:+ start:2368 stop:3135 length:768 start_codon:yes stop_codon:yes gene_type:complete